MSTAATTRYQRYNAKRRKDPDYLARQAEWNKAWYAAKGKTPEILARKAEQMREYSRAHGTKEHHQARRQVRSAIEKGILVRQSCEICGGWPTHAHHDDYMRPLEVRWLCPPHHREHHAKATGAAS